MSARAFPAREPRLTQLVATLHLKHPHVPARVHARRPASKERFHVEINLRTTLATTREGHLTVEVGATDNENATGNNTLRRMNSHAGEQSGKIQSPILLSACVHLTDLFADVDTLMTTSLKAGQLTAELWHGFRPGAAGEAGASGGK